MPTALIPEIIQPGVLYSPSANNFFALNAAALPNTDVGLNMQGAGIQRFKAYQPAILGVHYGWGANAAAITFWQRPSHSGGAAGAYSSTSTIFGVMNQNYANTSSYSNVTNAGQDANMAWVLAGNTATGYDRIHVLTEWRRGAAGVPGYLNRGSYLTQNVWAFLVYNRAATTGLWSCYTNGVLTNTGPTPVAMGSTPWNADLFFSLGAFSFVSGGPNNPPVDIGLAKLSIHPAELTGLEILDLLDSMNNGPPSP
jgi:hypothetical protein